MFGGWILVAAAFASPELAAAPDRDRCPDVRIVVFRHHPGLIDTDERTAARDRDAKALLQAARERLGGYDYSGGLGSGYELSVHARDLGRWKAAVDKLIKAGTLKYYAGWGLDRKGYGLVPVR